MTRTSLFTIFSFGSIVSVFPSETAYNVVYILADDMGYGDIKCYNPFSKIPTPALDALAASGMVFTDAHSNSSVSTPTRYGTLTGRYSFRSPMKRGVLTGYSTPLIDKGRETVASFLHKNGYNTACIGKWHLGLDWTKKDNSKPLFTGNEWDLGDTSNIDYSANITGGPNDCGFDYSYILPASLDMSPYVYIENEKITASVNRFVEDYKDPNIRGAHYRHGDVAEDFHHDECLSRFTDKSIEYILNASKEEKPYFLYCALTAPHSPWLIEEKFRGRSQAGTYGDFVCMVDDAVRRLCEAVKNSGKADKTLIIFTTDNGAMWSMDDITETGHYANGCWSGKKSDLLEGGHRVPLIVSCPGIIPSGEKTDALVSSVDLFATLADMNGLNIPEGTAEDSFSYWNILIGKQKNTDCSSRTSLVYHSDTGKLALRKGKWILLDCKGSGGWSLPEDKADPKIKVQLYDLEKDIQQKNNMSEKFPEIVNEMKKELDMLRE